MEGKFITFEGPEGSGKSTQSKLLYKYLKEEGYRVVRLREPGGTFVGERIRKILLKSEEEEIASLCELFLYMANHAQNVKEVIIPSLKKGRIVICDRFLDATICYQGYGARILDIGEIKRIGRIATLNLKPDLTIFLDIPVKRGLSRIKRQKDRIERRPLSYHRRIRRAYLELARLEPQRIRVIRSKNNPIQTQSSIRKVVKDFLNAQRKI